MTRIYPLTFLLILLIFVSACNTAGTPASQARKDNPEIKAKLEAARYELQLYEEELKAVNEEISAIEARLAKYKLPLDPRRDGPIQTTFNQMAKRNKLEEEVIQSKVKVRELETLLNEGPIQP